MLLFITVLAFGLNATAYFKTSHVIVYRCGPSAVTNVTIAFQNISCYCLSRIVVVAVNLALTFQNISCYCLSLILTHVFCLSIHISKHLMLLFIMFPRIVLPDLSEFQNISCYCLSSLMYSLPF